MLGSVSRGPVVAAGAALASAVALGACGEPLEFADWTVPVPDGTPVLEYAPVSAPDRSGRIEMVEDLVIGERDGDDNYMLYDAGAPQVAVDGTIYVLDAGNHRVQVFDADGDFVMTLGREGQGPGELANPSSAWIAGGWLYVRDFGNRRVNVWSLAGDPAPELPYPSSPVPSGMVGFDDGTMIGRVTLRYDDAGVFSMSTDPHTKLILYGSEIEALREIHDWPRYKVPSITRRSATRSSFMAMSVPTARPAVAATRDGLIFTTVAAEYQIRAYDRDAALRWALRVAWSRTPINDEEIVAAIERVRERIPDAARSEVDWPSARPAIGRIAVDGHGHLYVYPYPEDQEAADADLAAVDVYSADGEHLFSGLIRDLSWSDARGDFVYGRDTNDDTGEERIIRYRLVEPF